MRLSEVELINAVCHHIAERKGIDPHAVEAQLAWDEDHGFTAEVFADGRSQYLVETNLIEAIQRYLLTQYDMRVFRDQIELDVDDEMIADIRE